MSIGRRVTSRRVAVAAVAVGLALVAVPGSGAMARPVDNSITLTSQQLTDAGFPKKPNTTAWGNGTAVLPTDTAAQWQDVVLSGKAPSTTAPGQLLTMSRFVATDTKGSGTLKPLNITTVVKPDRTFSLHFQLGYAGTWGYQVGYSTGGTTPEQVGFQFQFTTTGSGAAGPKGSDTAVTLTAKQLEAAGFTHKPNVVAWGGTANLSAHKVKAGAPVTISGTAPISIAPGTVLTLQRFTATDKMGSGSFAPVGDIATVVNPDGSFSLTFEINEKGRYGYSLGAVVGQDQYAGIEFQLKTT